MKVNRRNVKEISWRKLGRHYRSKATKREKQLIRNELRRCGYLMAELNEFWR